MSWKHFFGVLLVSFLRGYDAMPDGMATRLFGFFDAGAALAPRSPLLRKASSQALSSV